MSLTLDGKFPHRIALVALGALSNRYRRIGAGTSMLMLFHVGVKADYKPFYRTIARRRLVIFFCLLSSWPVVKLYRPIENSIVCLLLHLLLNYVRVWYPKQQYSKLFMRRYTTNTNLQPFYIGNGHSRANPPLNSRFFGLYMYKVRCDSKCLLLFYLPWIVL